MPDLAGQAKADAETALTDAGLVADATSVAVSDPAEDDKVQTQNPAAGTQVAVGSTVAFTYGTYTAPPQVTVPNLIDETKADAETALSDAGLVADATSVAVSDPAEDDKVQTQNPAAGTQVAVGSTVAFTYGTYTAPPQVTVPNLIDETKADAETALSDAGLVADGTASTTADQSRDQTVFSQTPASGTTVDEGSTVSFDYYEYQAATGKVTVPDVLTSTTGFDKDEAEAAIRHVGLVPDAVATTTHDQSLDGDIYSQSPSDGAELDAGETVTFNYYAYAPRPKVDVPKVSGAWNDPAAFDLDGAKKKITDAGLVWEIIEFPRTTRPDLDGWIGAQSPGATSVTGDQVEHGSTVTMTVHRYFDPNPTVPNLIGMQKDDAEQALTDLGLVPNAQASFTSNSNNPDGQVLDQQPSAGTTASYGETVTFYYWKH